MHESHGDAAAAPLLELLREDWARHGRKWHRPGFHAVAVYRLGVRAARLPRPLRRAALALHGLLYFVTRNLYGIELPAAATVGRRFLVGHQSGIVIADDAVIGDDCLIRQNVTIGATTGGGGSPVIGDFVEIGAGAVLAGAIRVGDGAVIGPNAVVTTDVAPGAVLLAPPPRVLLGGPSARADGAAPTADGAPTLDRTLDVIVDSLALPERPDAAAPLISSGIVDSFNVVVLLTALEEAFGIEIPAEEVSADSFDTPEQIHARLVALAA
jgi:serine O-acetyltransferase